MVEQAAYPTAVVTWENVIDVLQLADKYDMPVVRGFCADFLSRNTQQMSISAALSSPMNVLTAASLLERYCSGAPELSPFVTAVGTALSSALSPLSQRQGGSAGDALCRNAVSNLRRLTESPSYTTTISATVQARVVSALLAGLESVSTACEGCRTGTAIRG
ncbi:hypothetical protein GPECTOR_4g695 [Gonium pectorale]|uniref:BTB domain-containing protein n=1 Tax=Gonium pectorale TaxID=33097 RepID=A0A150GZ67_GONPE|nr:hypothetical protein GPECTOR_4g695 [Gonium pectorale]|eukprot:KXZ54630.1 hypothetical protein GPECTOR_4g695 [Gonium pectorale]